MSLIKTTDPIYFGGVNLLSVSGLSITGTDTFRYPNRDVKSFALTQTDKSVTTSAFYSSRPVNIRGIIVATGREDLDTSISELRNILEAKNQTLQLPVFGLQRQLKNVTVSNVAFQDTAGGYTGFDIEFNAADPFFYGTTLLEVLSVINLTSGNKSYPITFSGTAKQEPIIRYIVDAVGSTTSRIVSLINPALEQTLAINRVWSVGDELIVNCSEKTVKVNGVDVEFTGTILYWSRGAGHINYTDEFSSRQVDLNVSYYKRDL